MDHGPDGPNGPTEGRRKGDVPRAWLFAEPSTAELARRLALAGPGARLTVIRYTSPDGLMRLYLRVLPAEGAVAAAADEPDINDAFPCPPFTGCGGG